MPPQTVHQVVTSPPYWGLRDYGVSGQLGLEPTPEEYTSNMVALFAEVHRVLRDDGTLWLNLGDTYATGAGKCRNPGSDAKPRNGHEGKQTYVNDFPQQQPNRMPIPGLKPKDLVGIPWRIAFALQTAGWYLRDCIIWHKPNPMPGSMTDRTCTSHEYIFLLSKSRRYYFDQVAIAEKAVSGAKGSVFHAGKTGVSQERCCDKPRDDYETRNPRSVWTIASKSYKEAHFATYPIALPIRCIKAGTSERGCCPACGAPWIRMTSKVRQATRPGTNTKVKVPSNWATGSVPHTATAHNTAEGRTAAATLPKHDRGYASGAVPGKHPTQFGNRDPERHVTTVKTTGWNAGCRCEDHEPVPCTVLDPFNGAASTGVAALKCGHNYIGIDLNPDYLELSERRLRPFREVLF